MEFRFVLKIQWSPVLCWERCLISHVGFDWWRMVIQMLVRYADKAQLEILELK